MPRKFRDSQIFRLSIAAVSCAAVFPVCGALAESTERVGRYLDRSVVVHDAAQLNPLEQVADIRIGSRSTVADALRLALAGTGYHLLNPEDHPDPESLKLLQGRIAVPHESFSRKRVDSVIAAVVGAGRGYRLEVDHIARRIRVVPLIRSVRPEVLARPAPDYRRVKSYIRHPVHPPGGQSR